MRHFQKRVICLIAMIFVLSVSLRTETAEAAEASKRRIAIVFDNSDSMVRDAGKSSDQSKYITRWADATYALETLICMLSDTDSVSLYTVDANKYDKEDGAEINKDNMVQVIQNMGVSELTCTDGLEKAYRWVNKEKDVYDERWVVLITDGEFINTPPIKLNAEQSIGKNLRNEENEGIQTICIGLDLEKDKQDEIGALADQYRERFTFYPTVNNTKMGIRDTILSISEKIYNMEKLDDSLIHEAGKEILFSDHSMKWTSDIPFSDYLQEIVILAQGTADLTVTEQINSGTDVVCSPEDFIWGGISEHNEKVGGNSSFFINKDCIQTGQQDTCLIRRYTGSELDTKELVFETGDRISAEALTYQIYYVISEKVVFEPEIIEIPIRSEKVASSESGQVLVTEGRVRFDYRITSDGSEVPRNLLAVRSLNSVTLSWDEEAVTARNDGITLAYVPGETHTLTVTYNKKQQSLTVAVEPDLTRLDRYQLEFVNKHDINMDDETDWEIQAQASAELAPWLLKNENRLHITVKNGAEELEYGKLSLGADGKIIIGPIAFENISESGKCTAEVMISESPIRDSYSFDLKQGEPDLHLTQTGRFRLRSKYANQTGIVLTVSFSGKERAVQWDTDQTVLTSIDGGDTEAGDFLFTVMEGSEDPCAANLQSEVLHWTKLLSPFGPAGIRRQLDTTEDDLSGIGLEGTVAFKRNQYNYRINIKNGQIVSAIRYIVETDTEECHVTMSDNFIYYWQNYLWVYTIVFSLLVALTLFAVVLYRRDYRRLTEGRLLTEEKKKQRAFYDDFPLRWDIENVPGVADMPQSVMTNAVDHSRPACRIDKEKMTIYLNTCLPQTEVLGENQRVYLTGFKDGYQIEIAPETKEVLLERGCRYRTNSGRMTLESEGDEFVLECPSGNAGNQNMRFHLVYQHLRNCLGERKLRGQKFVCELTTLFIFFGLILSAFLNLITRYCIWK